MGKILIYNHRNKHLSKKNRGFTLVELLVVISILTFIASLVFSAIVSSRKKARDATVKGQINQIMRAAELVYNDYGYYPNDSHGSVICPKDIVVDLVSGKTFGEYINICNDPFGNPYEWNNVCFNGNIRKYDGSGVNCPSYSDSNAGPVGIVYAGENGENDGCTGDDICFGDRGHDLFNWIDEDDGGGEPPDPTCTELTADCSGFADSMSCLTRENCIWTAGNCSGIYNASCDTFSDQSSCEVEPTCTWSGTGCSGTPNLCNIYMDSGSCGSAGCSWGGANCAGSYSESCGVFGTQGTCEGEAGCSWAGGCSGTPNTCSTYGDSGSCGSAGCSWIFIGCEGTAVSCSSMGDKTTCNSQSGCSYNNGAKVCEGTHAACTTYGDSGTCGAQLNCTWNSGGTCSGTPSSCSTYGDSGSCGSAGCSWIDPDCSGTYSASCSVFGTQGTCEGEAGCSWTGDSCSGTPTACSTYGDSGSCGFVGCSWADPDCSGSYSASCTVFGTQGACEGEVGCSWADDSCSGTPSDCSTFGDEGSCTTVNCMWGSSSCSGTYTGSCTDFVDEPSCTDEEDCTWNGGCGGTAVSCSTYTDEASCSGQSGCLWQ
jgi:prepilin-type N-terminal cleavage/methylation domain-containing protein